MTQDDVDFSAELEQYLDQHDYDMPKSGDIRKGTIVASSSEGVIVDLGLKRDGIVPPSDLAKLSDKERERLTADSEVSVYILETSQDTLNVSIHRALLNEDWVVAEELMNSGEIVEAEVVGYNRGGALVDYGRLRGFIPLSQLAGFRPGMKDRDKQRMLSKMRNENLPLKIIEVDRRRRRLVMSNREAQREWDEGRRHELLQELKAGEVVTGMVSSLRDFGAFVDLGSGLEGLVHVSELSWHRIDHPNEVISIGDDIEVYILKVDVDAQRVSLSRKRLLPDPWSMVEDKYAINSLVEGRITRIVNYGAFVELEPGIEGLLHASKMIRGSDNAEPEKVVQVGENHLLRVINVDSDRQRIGLSLRAVTPKEQIDWMMEKESQEAAAAAEAAQAAEATADEDGPVADGAQGAAIAIAASADEAAEAVDSTVETAVEQVDETADAVVETVEESVDAVQETASDTAEAIVETVDSTVDAVEETVEDAVEATAEAVEETVEAVQETADTTADTSTDAVAETVEAVDETVEEASAAISETVESVVETVEETADDAAEATADVVEDAIDATQEAVSDTAEAAADAVDDAVETVEDTADDAAEATADVVEDAVEATQEAVSDTAEAAADAVDDVVDTIEENTRDAAEATADVVEDAIDATQEAVSDTAEAAAEAVDDAVDTIEDNTRDAAEATADAIEETVETADETVEEAADDGASVAESAVEAVKETVGNVAEAISSTVESIKEKVSDAVEAVEDSIGDSDSESDDDQTDDA